MSEWQESREREKEKRQRRGEGGPRCLRPPSPPFPRAAVRGEGRSNGKSDEGLISRRMNLQSPAGWRWNWELARRGSAARYFTRELYRSVGGEGVKSSSSRIKTRFLAGVSTESCSRHCSSAVSAAKAKYLLDVDMPSVSTSVTDAEDKTWHGHGNRVNSIHHTSGL